MAHLDKEEFEKRISHLSDTTKTYIRAQMALLEKYVLRMQADDDIPQLQKLLYEDAEAMHAEYLAERERQGQPFEVGIVRQRSR
jgi:hypothetical protein